MALGVWWLLTSLPPKGNLPWLQLRHPINLHKVSSLLSIFSNQSYPGAQRTCLYWSDGVLWQARPFACMDWLIQRSNQIFFEESWPNAMAKFAHTEVPTYRIIESISDLIFQGEPCHLSLHCNARMLRPHLACQGGALQVIYSYVIPTCFFQQHFQQDVNIHLIWLAKEAL